MKNGKLLIHPISTNLSFKINNIYQLLDNIEFIGDRAERDDWTFSAGAAFLNLLTFMGCSPHVRFEPLNSGDDDYVYIRLLQSEKPQLLVSDNSRTPGCPACRKPAFADWSALENDDETPRTCQHCGTTILLSELRWKNDAGMARFFIEINSIFPGEAQPVESLMQQLEQVCGSPWRYFYLLRENDLSRS